MKKSKILTPILGFTAGLGALTPTITSCGNSNIPTVEKWYDITKLNYVPDVSADLSGVFFTKNALAQFYRKTMLKYPTVFEQDIVYSAQKMLLAHFLVPSRQEKGYKLTDVQKFRIKISNISFDDFGQWGETTYASLAFSCKIDYELKCRFTQNTTSHKIDVTGSLNIEHLPLIDVATMDSKSGKYYVFADEQKQVKIVETIIVGCNLNEASTVCPWKITMTEHGVSTARSGGRIDIDNLILDNNNIGQKNMSLPFGANLFINFNWSQNTFNWGFSYFNLATYFLKNIAGTSTYDPETGKWAKDYEEEGEEGGEEDGGQKLSSTNSRVLI